MSTRILIADDEPLLRAELRDALAALWPSAQIVAEAEDGFAALRLAESTQPQVAFLDIRMPGASGLDVAAALSGKLHVVFITAYDQHALAAFEQGAIDYVVKPIELARLARTVQRLRERVATPPPALDGLLTEMQKLNRGLVAQAPTWIQAAVGNRIQFIALTDILYFCAEDKYTKVVSAGGEAHIRTPIRDLAEQLESGFWQIHRGFLVSTHAIEGVTRDEDGAMWLQLRNHASRLPVSQRFQYRFKGM